MKITRRELVRRLSAIGGAGAVGSVLPLRVIAQSGGGAAAAASVTPAGMDTGTLMWDGPSGVSNLYFNWGVQLPWRKAGGDWLDAAQVPHGSARYATIAWPVAGPATANITPIVKAWYQFGNTGLFLRSVSNAIHAAARANPDASIRPAVIATLSDGATITLPCSASGVCNSSAFYPVTGPTLAVTGTSPLVLQFTLVPLAGRTVTSAILKVTATRVFGGTASFAIFELDPPRIFDGGTPQLGIAAKYGRDAGIEGDPQVYFATRFGEPLWKQTHFPSGNLASDAVTVQDPALNSPALRVTYHKGEHSPCALNHMWSQRVAGARRLNVAGTLKTYENIHPSQYDTLANQDCPSEVYFRYYLKLHQDYQCSTDHKKLPGIAGRYGYWHWSGADSGYYQAVNGNGGSPTKGTKILDSRYPGGFHYSGWSTRQTALRGPDDANPYGDHVIAGTYAYHAAQTGYYGDVWRWGTPESGYVAYAPDRWYCIEQYVKMNTISAPFDASGNGRGNADGILRAWVDGVLVFEKKDMLYRHHPAIRVDEVWLSHYHGGGLPPEEPHTFEMTHVVVANAYIGPMANGPVVVAPPPPPVSAAPGPAWLAGKPLNQWIAIAGTEMTKASVAAQAAAGLTDALGRNIGYGDPRRGIFAYSGGALKKAGSELLVFGGGYAAWAGNDVRGLRLEDAAPTWATRVVPTVASKVRSRTDGRSAYMMDGVSPNTRHSYWAPQFIDAQDTFIAFGCAHPWSGGLFLTVDGAPMSTGRWKTPGSHPNIPLPRGWDGNWACKHPVTEDVYVSGARGVARWQASLNRWSLIYLTTRTDVDRGTAAIDPTGGGTLLRIGAAGATLAIDLATGTATQGKLTGSFASAINIGAYYAAGLVFDPGLGRFVLFQDDGHLYTIAKVSAASWAVERMSLTGVAPQTLHSSNGYTPAIWGRMQYVPNLKGICIVQAHDRPAYFVRTA